MEADGASPIRTTQSVRRGYVPAEQGITPANFLLFSLTAECNIAGRDWGRRTYK